MCFWDGETVDNSIGLVLLLHLVEHLRDDGSTGLIVSKNLFGCLSFGQQLLNFGCSHLCQFLFIGFGIIAKLTTNKTLTVAHKPYLTAAVGIDDGRGAEAFFWVSGEQLCR